MIALFQEKDIPYLVAYNKCELVPPLPLEEHEIAVSALQKLNLEFLKERIGQLTKTEAENQRLVRDLLSPGDLVVLVTPIDSAAPKGRLILPQQQTIRDILDAEACSLVVKETGLPEIFRKLAVPPALVITDSQAFAQVNRDTPKEIPLTSFSILMARYKGFLETAVKGVAAIDTLQDGDKILISEGCTHHRQCNDIGTVKLPKWLREYSKKELQLEYSSGLGFPEDLSPYRLIIHCGACMLPQREVLYRQKYAQDAGVPFTNYGITIAHLKGILKRSIELFPHLHQLLL